MAYCISFTTKHGTDHFGSFDTYEEAEEAALKFDVRALRLEHEGVTASIDVVGPPYVGDLDALDDLLTEMEKNV